MHPPADALPTSQPPAAPHPSPMPVTAMTRMTAMTANFAPQLGDDDYDDSEETVAANDVCDDSKEMVHINDTYDTLEETLAAHDTYDTFEKTFAARAHSRLVVGLEISLPSQPAEAGFAVCSRDLNRQVAANQKRTPFRNAPGTYSRLTTSRTGGIP